MVRAQNYNDVTGVTLLRAVGTNVNGAGVHVGQVEAAIDANGVGWEIQPNGVPEPTNLFTWYSDNTSSTQYPNALGTNSWHATEVGQYFYGQSVGVATNVAHVDNYNADYFLQGNESVNGTVTNFTFNLPSGNINDSVVNQSFIVLNNDGSHVTSNEEAVVDSTYDTYAATYGTLFVNGAGNGDPTYISPPASCYNGIGVGVYNGGTSGGPAYNGQCKPDITADGAGGDTSFSTPLVAGAAALLVQAGLRGDGGGNTNAAANMITVKALLLNGAVKPANWANVPPSPLDYRYGAGFLNVFN
jgi:Subtilase family